VRRVLLTFAVVVAMTASAETPSVTLDVKDADVRVILKSMQKQCGIKNLLIDKDVNGAGTIYFKDVPCDIAFRTVFAQFSLKGHVEQNMVTVEPR
jgi:type II secretory pathway component GspD/PulD (secretin)